MFVLVVATWFKKKKSFYDFKLFLHADVINTFKKKFNIFFKKYILKHNHYHSSIYYFNVVVISAFRSTIKKPFD